MSVIYEGKTPGRDGHRHPVARAGPGDVRDRCLTMGPSTRESPRRARLVRPRDRGSSSRRPSRHWRTCLPIAAMFAVPWGVANAVSRSSTRILDPRTLTTTEAADRGDHRRSRRVGALVVIALFLGSICVGALSLVGSAAVYGDVVERAGDRPPRVRPRARRRRGEPARPARAGHRARSWSGSPARRRRSSSSVARVRGPDRSARSSWSRRPSLYVGVHLALARPGRDARRARRRRCAPPVVGARRRARGCGCSGSSSSLASVPVVVQQVAEPSSDAAARPTSCCGRSRARSSPCCSVVLFGVAAGVVYACRAPEDTSSRRRCRG